MIKLRKTCPRLVAGLVALSLGCATLFVGGARVYAAAQPVASFAEPSSYTVKPGDTLSAIADSLGVSGSAIQEANGIKDANSIQVGMVLTIPTVATPQPTPPPDAKYTVKAGDTLSSIAVRFAVSVALIQQANGIQDPDSVKIGTTLTIPGGGVQASPATTATPAPSPATPTPTPVVAADGKYTVKQGDTLASIAGSFGITLQALKDANGIQDANRIKADQVLTIPGGRPQRVTTPAPQQTPAPASTPAPTATTSPPQAAPTPTATAAAQASPTPRGDPRYFDETGFRIDNDKFWEYFQRRGGVKTFGYPISKEFTLLGFRVQFFQRLIMQLRPEGAVATMNLLDDGIMPFTRINFSTFPGPDKDMAAAAPRPGTDGYFDRLLAFVKERSPNEWNGLPVNFYKAFCDTVRYEDAYPDKSVDPGIMPAINLEMWGVPISPPSYDPNNKNFVYLRFQRGIMHYDKTTGTTQGLLLGDYLKSIMTGWNLPPDLADQAKGSRFYMQYSPGSPHGLARPNDLPGTDMNGAFTRDGLVVIDAGHGGTEIGAAHIYSDNKALLEKDLNLKIALKTADILRRAGRQVQLTRTKDTQVNNPPRDRTGNGRVTLDDDLESRVDIANNAGAELFLSIHFNGSGDSNQNGIEVYYNAQRPFSGKNKQFAQMVLDNALASVKAGGYNMVNRGVKSDEQSVGKGNSFYLLGPTHDDKPRAMQMVGALAEGGFLTNDQDSGYLRQDKYQDALALGYAKAIMQYFSTIGK